MVFTLKFWKLNYPLLFFSDCSLKQTSKQKHLRILFDFKFKLWRALKISIIKIVTLLCKFLRLVLLTSYKCFVRTHHDYDNIIDDKVFNNHCH